MKIQNISNFTNFIKSTKPVKHEETVKTKNYDVIEIKGKSHNSDTKLGEIKKDVVSKVHEETHAEKVSRIKESINNKTYSIDVEEIVNKLLK